MTIEIPPMEIVSDNERLVPVIRYSKVGKQYPAMVLNTKYDICMKQLVGIMKEQIPSDWVPSKDIVWELFARTYKDVTNLLKILGDSMEKAGVIKNDADLTTVFIVKYKAKRGSLDNVRMRIDNLGD